MNSKEKIEIIEGVFKSSDLFLCKDYNYNLSHLKKNEKLELIFENAACKRQVEIHFLPINAKNEDHELMIIYINKQPCKLAKDSINIENYLRYKNLEDYEKVQGDNPETYYQKLLVNNNFYLINYIGNFQSRLNAFNHFFKKVIDNHFKEIILGHRWEEIPFDWGSYK